MATTTSTTTSTSTASTAAAASPGAGSFNLVVESWIEVLGPDDPAVWGVRETLVRAHEVRAVLGELPTMRLALTWLLGAVVARAVQAAGLDPAACWRPDGALPVDAITAYLDRHADRFDLFDPGAPFMQVPGLKAANGVRTPVTRIVADVPAGHPFFTTRVGNEPVALGVAEAARWLVHVHAYDVDGINTGMAGDRRVKGGKGYGIGPGWTGSALMIGPEGATLAETLLMWLPHQLTMADRPPWERAPDGPGSAGRAPAGPVDLAGPARPAGPGPGRPGPSRAGRDR